MKERTLFILNPKSGNGKGERFLPGIKSFLSRHPGRADLVLTERQGHAIEIVKSNKSDFGKICIIGGDGTLNEAVNGLDEFSDNAIGIIPSGSGNDFARAVGMAKEVQAGLDLMLRGDNIKEVDLGMIEFFEKDNTAFFKRLFINSAGIGFDALVSDIKNKNGQMSGLPQYIAATLKALSSFSPVQLSARFDDYCDSGDKLLIAISNGKTYGGGLKVNPYADIFDGRLDACVVNKMPLGRILYNFPKLVLGKHIGIKGVSTRQFYEASIHSSDKPFYIHTDGEVISTKAKEVKIKVLNKRLKFIFSRG